MIDKCCPLCGESSKKYFKVKVDYAGDPAHLDNPKLLDLLMLAFLEVHCLKCQYSYCYDNEHPYTETTACERIIFFQYDFVFPFDIRKSSHLKLVTSRAKAMEEGKLIWANQEGRSAFEYLWKLHCDDLRKETHSQNKITAALVMADWLEDNGFPMQSEHCRESTKEAQRQMEAIEKKALKTKRKRRVDVSSKT